MSPKPGAKGSKEPAGVRAFREQLERGEIRSGSYVTLVGLKTSEPTELREHIRDGISYRAWERFERNSGLDREALLDLVDISARTLDRRKLEGRLQPDESDRLLRASRVFARALELFEGKLDQARGWFMSPQPGLGGASPLDFVGTEVGAREVENLIGRLEHGIPT